MPKIGFDRWIELIFAAAIAGATIFNVLVARMQWQAMNETNQISTRPYIKVKLRPETFILPKNGDGGLRGVRFLVENTGKLPAMLYIQSAVNYQAGGHNGDDQHWPSINLVGEKFVFPGDPPAEFTSQTLSITKGGIVDLGGNSGRFFALVDVFYGPAREFETHVCNVYLMAADDAGEYRLSDEQPCPHKENNYAK
jgi:hypothetical protein